MTEVTVPRTPEAYELEGLNALPPVPQSVTAFQFIAACVGKAYITEAEGEAWMARNSLPAALLAVIAALPVEQQFGAKLRAIGMTTVDIDSPLILAALGALGLNDDDRDDLFHLAGLI